MGGCASSSASPIELVLMVRGRRPASRSWRSRARVVHAVEVAGAEQHAAARLTPRADERRQAGDGAHGRAAAAVPLQAVVHANRGRTRGGVVAREPHDRVGRNTADVRGALGGILLHPLTQRVEAHGEARHVVGVVQALVDDHVHHRQRQRGVGTGPHGDVVGALLGGEAAVGIDHHHARAPPLGLLHARPVVQVRGDGIRTPDQDQPRFLHALRIHAHAAAERDLDAHLAGRRAQRAIEQRRAEMEEEPAVHAREVEQAHGARVAVGADRFGPIRRVDDGLELRGDGRERLVPRDALPRALAGALAADAAMRIHHAVGGVGAVEVARHLGAQRAIGEGVRFRAGHLDGHAVLHGGFERAGIGAVVRARALHDAHIEGGVAHVTSIAETRG